MSKVNELLRLGYLEYSVSDWSSPVWPKFINGKLDICVDYSKLNAITKDYETRLPSVSKVLNSINESNVFSKVCLW